MSPKQIKHNIVQNITLVNKLFIFFFFCSCILILNWNIKKKIELHKGSIVEEYIQILCLKFSPCEGQFTVELSRILPFFKK